MTVPYRSFTDFDHATLDLLDANVPNSKGSWSASHIANAYFGFQKNGDGTWAHWWYGIAKPSSARWALLDGGDEVVSFQWKILFSLIANTTARAQYSSLLKTSSRSAGEVVDMSAVSGQVYKAGTDWTAYPGVADQGQSEDGKFIVFGDLPKVYWLYGCPYRNGVGTVENEAQAYYFLTGFNARMGPLWGGDPAAGEIAEVRGVFQEVRVRVFNPVVNSISKSLVSPLGGDELVLSGLGFHNDDDELTDATNNPNSSTPGGGWIDDVREILFIGRSGEGTFTLTSAGGDFTVDSNNQITIDALPTLPIGTYEIKLRKTGVAARLISGNVPEAFAGDYLADVATGEMSEGLRIVLTVGVDEAAKKKKTPLLGTDWEFLVDGLIVHKYYAPIDIRAPARFYDGRILRNSNFARSVSSGLGTYLGSDIDITLSNADREFSRLLFDAYVKNQGVALYYIWSDGAETARTALSAFVVDDYELQGPEFRAKLRDIGAKYFQTALPLYRCTVDEFPNIYEKAINFPKPEILGTFAFSGTDKKGAILAAYVDTVNFIYLAARGSLHAITAVYSAGVLVDPANYTVSYDVDGQTLITFAGDQGDNDITFDCEGYAYAGYEYSWNSPAGFVQNPAYVLAFFLAFIVGVPASRLDVASFDVLAAYFDGLSLSTAGKFAATGEEPAGDYFSQLLYSYGTLAAFDRLGRWTVARKDLSTLGTSKKIWAQIDTLDHPVRQFNTASAFNRLRARWDYVPAADLFKGGAPFESGPSILALGTSIEPSTDPDFKWIDSAAWIAIRADEELRRYAFGDNKFIFSLPIDFLDEVDLLDDVSLQDLFGVTAAGEGDAGRLMYIEALTPDFETMRIDVVCSDLAWLLAEVFILGSPLMDENWSDAGPEERNFGYLCGTLGTFADGVAGKKL